MNRVKCHKTPINFFDCVQNDGEVIPNLFIDQEIAFLDFLTLVGITWHEEQNASCGHYT